MADVKWDDSEGEENEDGEKTADWGGRDGVIFLIDATETMFIKDEEENIPFKTCLLCCKTMMLNKIIGSAKDLIGIVLFGTDKSSDPNMKHIIKLQKFDQPSAENIKQLGQILDSDIMEYVKNNYGHSDDFALSDALWQSQMLFSNCSLKLASQRILLFTCTDNPHANDPHRQRQALDRARDLGQSGIELELLNMGQNFDVSVFYQELIQETLGDDSDDFSLPDPTTKLEELLTRVCRQNHKKRSVGRVIFKLGNGVQLSVGLYNLVRRTAPPKKVWLDRKTNDTVHSVQQYFDGATGETLLPMDLAKYQDYGGERIVFQMEEVRNARQMMEQGLYLMGFKPSERIKIHYHLKPAGFVYPDESKIKGSRKLFAALLERCVARNVVPICWLSARLNSHPQLVALVPQQEQLDESRVQILPPGFHLVYLPYAENFRSLEEPEVEEVSPEQLSLMKKIISKLRFKYDPHSFDNPKLQTLWSNIEGLALDLDTQREVEDYTKPDHDMMARKLGDLAEKFQEMFYPPGFDPESKRKATATKRPGPAVKTDKTKVMKEEDVICKVQDFALNGQVEKCKVDELKAYLSSENISVSGKKKADLTAMVCKHLDIPYPK